jgi:hypothetical protein
MWNLYIVPFITFSSEPANRKLTKELCDMIDDFGLVNFSTLDIQVCIWKIIKIYFPIVLVLIIFCVL